MYQRTYKEGYTLPENYRGTAIEECLPYENVEEAVHSAPPPPREEEIPCSCSEKGNQQPQGRKTFFERLPFHMPRFEGEDLLILGVAALLFFSKDGDKECALLLLFLLFVG